MTDISDLDSAGHTLLAEEGAVLAQRQEDGFVKFCESISGEMLADRETMILVLLKMGVVQVTLAAAQLHATLALVKK